jgi:hypothetical protein
MIHKFLEQLENKSQLPSLLAQLQQFESKTIWSKDDHILINDHILIDLIDNQFTTLLLSAEKESALPSQHQWSPEFRHAQLKYTYWLLSWKSRHNRIEINQQLTDILNQIPNNDPYHPIKNRQTLTQLRHSRKYFINCRINSYELRDKFLSIQHETLIYQGKMQKADAIRHKHNREKQQKCWQLLRTIIHGNKTSGGISHVLIPLPPDINTPQEPTPPQRIQTKQDMDNVLIDRNIDHFAQAHGTPFTIPPLLDLFGTDGCTEAALSVLDGNIPTTVPHYSK